MDWVSSRSLCWFALGILNNTPYLIMLATAKYFSEGGTGVVYIASTVPGLLVKLSSPYWFDFVSYYFRMTAASACMALAFLMTSYYSRADSLSLTGQLIGVAVVSIQIGMGEASLLALAGKLDSAAASSFSGSSSTSTTIHPQRNRSSCLVSFSSGTGLAGPLGYLFKVSLTEWFGWSVTSMLAAGVLLSFLYWGAFRMATTNALPFNQHHLVPSNDNDDTGCLVVSHEQEMASFHQNLYSDKPAHCCDSEDSDEFSNHEHCNNPSTDDIMSPSSSSTAQVVAVGDMTVQKRFRLVLSLWPYTVPLFTVYAAEYACQAGAWTAIGFPTVDSVDARARFYEQSNWLYQAGSFVSRTSGAFFTVSLPGLWLIPLLQVINLIFFSITAATHGYFYHRGLLLAGSLYTGLLGGAVYVQGYLRIVQDMPEAHTEFALSSTCVAEALGVLVADVFGLYLQSCLYSWHDLSGALVKCPL